MFEISPEKAPARGILLAYFSDALVFEPYEIRDGRLLFDGCEAYPDQLPWEIHLFDRDTEYRIVWREARKDRIERVMTKQEEESMDPDLLYTEIMPVKEEYLKKGTIPEQLSVTTRYRWSEQDTLVMQNYRINF